MKAKPMISVSPIRQLKEAVFRLRVLTERFREEIGGVAAIEFAFLAPLMLLMYIGTIEVSSAVSANRKLSRVSSTIGDLVTQLDVTNFAGNCIPKTVIEDIVKIADDIMFPYPHTLGIVITGVEVVGSAATVIWSEAYDATKDSVGSSYTLPTQIASSEGFIVAASTAISYTPLFGFARMTEADGLFFETTAIPMKEILYLRPRIGANLTICP